MPRRAVDLLRLSHALEPNQVLAYCRGRGPLHQRVGHDFRPEYLQIGELVCEMPDCRVLACTATATPVVRDEILERLGLPSDTPQLVRGFARPNLALRVAEINSASERRRQIDALLAEALSPSGQKTGTAIVYAPTRKSTRKKPPASKGPAGWRPPITRACRGQTATQFSSPSFKTKSKSWWRPMPLAWVSIAPTCAPSPIWLLPIRLKRTTKK